MVKPWFWWSKGSPFWKQAAIALLSGMVMALAVAPINAWWLAWIALMPLWSLIQSTKGGIRSRLGLGLAWGIGYHGLALAWITGLHPLTWMGVPWLASLAITLFCWLFITLWGGVFVALWAGWMARLTPTWSVGTRILAGMALWCGLEWLWNQSPLWWTSLAFTQSPTNLVMLHLGQISGPATVAAALVAVNGLLAEAWRSTQRRWRYLAIALFLFASLHLLGWSLYSQPLTPTPATALKVGIIQGNIPVRIKLYAEGLRRALHNYTQGYQQLAAQGVDAILLPEAALPFLWVEPQSRQNALVQAMREQHVVAWVGTFVPQDGKVTQSLLTLTSNGDSFSRYNKVKLVPLGEYIPFAEVLGGLISRLSPVKSDLTPGQPGQRFDTPFGPATVGICFDSAFADLFRQQTAAGGELILTASNNDPYDRAMLSQHQAQDVMRAIENDRWAVRATNTGFSGIVDPHGQIHWRSQMRTYEIHADTIYRRQTQTLYVRWGDWLTPLLLALMLLAGLVEMTWGRGSDRPGNRNARVGGV